MSKTITDEKEIDKVLNRGVIIDVLPDKESFKKLLMSGKKIRIYVGFDATSDTLHLSHAKNIMVLEEFRKLGHEVILLFGDFTAQIGDPSGQQGTRKSFSKKEILHNIKKWRPQIKNLMNFTSWKNPPKILRNSRWLAKMNMEGLTKLASLVTVQQMIERDMFQKRINEGKHIFLHEFLYPIMQGYDSVAMNVDAELCGSDQIFNALMGRTLLKKIKSKDKFVIVVNLMENPKTGDLMSKSKGTGVFLNTKPHEMFGAIMAQPDEMVEVLVRNCTRLDMSIDEIQKDILISKKKVALEIIKIIFGSYKIATEAQENWEKTFSKKEIPENLEEFVVNKEEKLMDFLVSQKIVSSKSDFRRLIDSGSITKMETKEKIEDPFWIVADGVYRIGKKRFIKIVVK